MKQQVRVGWAVLVAACCLSAACIQSDDAREEFCRNADPGRQQGICDTDMGDGGTKLDGGTDGGTQPTGCKVASDCPTPQPGSCIDSRACVDGQCLDRPKNDGDACSGTPSEQCKQSTGTCKSGSCEYTRQTSGPCDDGDSCTLNDSCNASGNCGGTQKSCNTPPNTQCYEAMGTCNKSSGECIYPAKSSSTTCNDGDSCTENDLCNGAGNCRGTAITCNQPSLCQEPNGMCVEGTCRYPPTAANTPCDDRSVCTDGELCNGNGACVPGSYLSCPDAYCARGVCDPTSGCRQESCPPNLCIGGICEN